MKRVFFLLLFPVVTVGQHKHDNAIIIKNISLDRVVHVLQDSGYAIEKYDTAHGFIITQAKSIENYFTLVLNAELHDSSVTITGAFHEDVSLNISGFDLAFGYKTIELKGADESEAHRSFNEMRSFASGLAPNVEYAHLKLKPRTK